MLDLCIIICLKTRKTDAVASLSYLLAFLNLQTLNTTQHISEISLKISRYILRQCLIGSLCCHHSYWRLYLDVLRWSSNYWYKEHWKTIPIRWVCPLWNRVNQMLIYIFFYTPFPQNHKKTLHINKHYISINITYESLYDRVAKHHITYDDITWVKLSHLVVVSVVSIISDLVGDLVYYLRVSISLILFYTMVSKSVNYFLSTSRSSRVEATFTIFFISYNLIWWLDWLSKYSWILNESPISISRRILEIMFLNPFEIFTFLDSSAVSPVVSSLVFLCCSW